MFPDDAPPYRIIEHIAIQPVEGRQVDTATGLIMLGHALAPAHVSKIEGWIAELSMLVHMRRQDPFYSDLMLRVWTDRLRQYPADVVWYILRLWPGLGAKNAAFRISSKFWPAWSDIHPMLEGYSQWRRKACEALQLHHDS